MKTLVMASAVLVAMGLWMSSQTSESSEAVLWPGQPAYQSTSERLSISAESAHSILLERARGQRQPALEYVNPSPALIVGVSYFFPSVPSKVGTRLQGFYVNGVTGHVEYRGSRVSVEKSAKTLPAGAYDEIEAID